MEMGRVHQKSDAGTAAVASVKMGRLYQKYDGGATCHSECEDESTHAVTTPLVS